MKKIFAIVLVVVTLLVGAQSASANINSGVFNKAYNITTAPFGKDILSSYAHVGINTILEHTYSADGTPFLVIPAGVSKGIFDERTWVALKKFQELKGIKPADGYYRNSTAMYTYALAGSENGSFSGTTDLVVGSNGTDIANIQLFLAQQLSSDGTPFFTPKSDPLGHYGTTTHAAFLRFQQSVGLAPITRLLSNATTVYIKNLAAERKKSQPLLTAKIYKVDAQDDTAYQAKTGTSLMTKTKTHFPTGVAKEIKTDESILIEWETSRINQIRGLTAYLYDSVSGEIFFEKKLDSAITPNGSGFKGVLEYSKEELNRLDRTRFYHVSICGENIPTSGQRSQPFCSKNQTSIQFQYGTLTVNYPNSAVTISAGNTINIRWNSSPFIKEFHITYQGEKTGSRTIAQRVASTSYQWTIPTTIPSGKYKIGIFAINPGRGVINDVSDAYFTIVGGSSPVVASSTATSSVIKVTPPITTPVTTPVAPAIRVLSPNTTVTINAGLRTPITWTSTGFSNVPKFWITYTNQATTSITGPIANDVSGNSYQWNVPTTLAPGSYKITVKNASGENAPVSDSSDVAFTITAPKVILPTTYPATSTATTTRPDKATSNTSFRLQIANVVEIVRALFSK